MKTLGATQAPLVARAHLAPVTLARVELFSDRTAETVGETLYLASRPVRYDYGNTGTVRFFWPVVTEIRGFREAFDHLPNPRTLGEFDRRVALELANVAVPGGLRLAERLRQTYRLENARIQVAQLLVSESDLPAGLILLDLEALGFAGDEHTLLAEGRVRRVGPVTSESLELEMQTELPTFPWLFAEDATLVDPKDLGQRLPVVYGQARHVRCLGMTVGWTTTLAEEITDATTGNVAVSDATGLPPAGSFSLRLGNEEVTATRVDVQTINISARGINSTTAATHGRGELALELLASVVFTAAGHESSAVDAVYVKNPATGALVRLESGDYTANLTNTTLVSGETLTTITFTAAQLRAVLDELFADVALDTGNVELFVPFTARKSSTYTGAEGTLSGLGGTPRFDGHASNTDTAEVWWPTGSGLDTREVIRWKLRLVGNGKSDSAGRDVRAQCRTQNLSGWANGTVPVQLDFPQGAETFGLVAESAWATPSGGTTVDDLESSGPAGGPYCQLYLILFGAGTPTATEYGEFLLSQCGIVAEVAPAAAASIKGSVLGFGLELFADVSGTVAPASPGPTIGTPATWPDTDAASDYTLLSGNSINDDAVVEVDGSSVRIDETGTTNMSASAILAVSASPDFDFSAGDLALVVRVRWTSTATAVAGHFLRVRLWNAGETLSAFRTYELTALTESTWHEKRIAPLVEMSIGGGWDLSDVAKISVEFGQSGLSGSFSSSVWWDQVETAPILAPAPASYLAAEGTLLEHPVDVIQHVVNAHLGQAIDLESALDATAALSGAVLAADLRTIGYASDELLAALGYHARANIVPAPLSATQRWRILTASSAYGFGAAAASITRWTEIAEVGRDLEGLETRWTIAYAPDVALGQGDALFGGLLVANPTTSDLTTTTTTELGDAEDDHGRRDAFPILLPAIQDEDTAKEVGGYYVAEGIREASTIAVEGIPWDEGYRLEPGDLVDVTLPWQSASIKLRLVEVDRRFATELVSVRGVTV